MARLGAASARNYKVIRLDLRGFGDSTPMPLDYEWSLDGLAERS